ncbi:MAG TPA: glycosyltransferase family 2 protein [Candidatus Saccharimonadales bacterium]
MRLLVVSICKNEAATIAELIQRIPKKYAGVSNIEICIVDDGSTDDTAALARKAGATVYSDGANKGLAYRFREVLTIALDKGTDVLVNIDGDLQFMPEDISKIVTPVLEGDADFVAADRFFDTATGKLRRPQNMPAGKYYGNKLGARVVSNLAGRHFNDVTCGFRAYNRDAMLALNLSSTHTYTQESFQVLAAKRLRIITVPTKVVYYKGRKSRVVSSLFSYIGTSTLNILRAYRDFAPLSFFFRAGLIPFVIGLACLIALGIRWIIVGQFSPFKFVGFAGLYLITLGFFLWGLGLMADMLVRVQNTQERIYEDIKRLRYPKDK